MLVSVVHGSRCRWHAARQGPLRYCCQQTTWSWAAERLHALDQATANIQTSVKLLAVQKSNGEAETSFTLQSMKKHASRSRRYAVTTFSE